MTCKTRSNLALTFMLVAGTGAIVAPHRTSAQTPAPAATAAVTPPSGPIGEVQGSYNRLKGYILKAADNTPAEDYQVKPTPEIRTFARVVEHVIEAQNHVCGALNHTAPADMAKTPADTADKAAIIDGLKASFAECDKAYAAASTTNMTDIVDMGPVKRSRIGLLWGNVSHDNEQYATLALYMRLKGLVPPSSEK
ncbi:MAG TPA: DinB family protein [Acidisarcina sp.]